MLDVYVALAVLTASFAPTRLTTAEQLKRNFFSIPEECARTCNEGEPAKTCYYHFNLEYYTTMGEACLLCVPNSTNQISTNCQCVAADGVKREILTVNRMIPGPSIQVCEGDKVIVDVQNRMEGMDVTIHWHGVWQNESPYYDGVPYVTQCPVQEGNTFGYEWTADNPGTHYWYSHTGLQKFNGLHGSIIIRQTHLRESNRDLYDYDLNEHVMILSDWMHTYAANKNTEQIPDSLLVNGKGQYRNLNTGSMTNTSLETFTVASGERYRFRMINSFSSSCAAQLTIEGHSLTIIATDGSPVEPVQIDTIISFSGERYDFVINADQDIGAYWIQIRGLGECGTKKLQQLAILIYGDGVLNKPNTAEPTYDEALFEGLVFNPLNVTCNGTDAVCLNQLNSTEIEANFLNETVNIKTIALPFRFYLYNFDDLFIPKIYNRYLVLSNGDHVSGLMGSYSFLSPTSPLISQHDLSSRYFCGFHDEFRDCEHNCLCINKIDIRHNSIVEIILVDEVQRPNLNIPFHLHGYTFKVVALGRLPDADKISVQRVIDMERNGLIRRNTYRPPSKDTITVPNNGYAILRFRAHNRGFWEFHSTILSHQLVGMKLVLQVGTRNRLPTTPHRFPTCGNYFPPDFNAFTNKFWKSKH